MLYWVAGINATSEGMRTKLGGKSETPGTLAFWFEMPKKKAGQFDVGDAVEAQFAPEGDWDRVGIAVSWYPGTIVAYNAKVHRLPCKRT